MGNLSYFPFLNQEEMLFAIIEFLMVNPFIKINMSMPCRHNPTTLGRIKRLWRFGGGNPTFHVGKVYDTQPRFFSRFQYDYLGLGSFFACGFFACGFFLGGFFLGGTFAHGLFFGSLLTGNFLLACFGLSNNPILFQCIFSSGILLFRRWHIDRQRCFH